MNIRTIKDVHPEDIYVMPRQYKAIKHAKSGKPFEIKDNQIAQQLIVLDLVKKEEVRKREILGNGEKTFFDEETGKYLLTPDGEIYLDYKKQKSKDNFGKEFRAWATLIIALAALGLSILSLYIQYLDYIAG